MNLVLETPGCCQLDTLPPENKEKEKKGKQVSKNKLANTT